MIVIVCYFMVVGPSFIRVNQSALRPRKQQEIEIRNEHKDISTKVQNYLASYSHYVPPTASIMGDYSYCLLDYFNHCYCTPLSYYDRLRQIRVITFTMVQRLNLIIKHKSSSLIRMHSSSYPTILSKKYYTKLFDFSTNLRRKNVFYNGNVTK